MDSMRFTVSRRGYTRAAVGLVLNQVQLESRLSREHPGTEPVPVLLGDTAPGHAVSDGQATGHRLGEYRVLARITSAGRCGPEHCRQAALIVAGTAGRPIQGRAHA
jgi:hypothetical protein